MIWLVGNRGMLGSEVDALLRQGEEGLVTSDREVDITSEATVRDFAAEHRPRWIINCAAYTAVDQAEDEEETAHRLNAIGPENLARAAADQAARIIHISTDYVFDGQAANPYTEYTPVNPIGAYGRTKAEGERRLAKGCSAHFVLRTAWLYGKNGKNFVSTMLRLMNERETVNVVRDQHGSPTYAVDLASALISFVQQNSTAYGTYHFTNRGRTTWYGFAEAVLREGRRRGLINGAPTINPVSTREYPTKAARPGYSVLATERIRNTLGIRIPPWEDGLRRYLDQKENDGRRE